MPCRPLNLCCFQEQCLWITDDVLTDAWNRFTRSTHVKHRKDGGRRPGSNIPGPLEAHRRLAKRRMAVSAHAVGATSPGFDLGALFGLGAFGSNRRLDDWKYEPPGAKKKQSPHSAWSFGLRSKDNTWEKFLRAPDPLETQEAATRDPVADSKAAFERLLSPHQLPIDIQAGHLNEILVFLQTAADEPGAQNAVRLAQWLVSRPSSFDAFQSYLALILEKARLHSLTPSELSSILSYCLMYPEADRALSEMSDIIVAAAESAATVCITITGKILETITEHDLEVLEPNQLLDLWLRCLRQCGDTKDHDSVCEWDAIYSLIAPIAPLPSALADHLSTLPHTELSQVLARHWIHHFISWTREISFKPTERSENIMHIEPEDAELSTKRISEQLQREYEAYMGDIHWHEDPLSSLLQACWRTRTSKKVRNDLANDILTILLQSKQPDAVYFVYGYVHHDHDLTVSTDVATRLIKYFLDANYLPQAWNVFKAHREVPLSQCRDLPLRLIKSGLCNSALIWGILQRQTPKDKIPEPERVRPTLALTNEHVDLIHEIAFAYAKSPHVTSRMACRRVWECYLFLRDHHAPIAPLLARASVHAGVSRYLKEGRRIPYACFEYVTNIVARIEGQQMADALERVTWRIWREHVQPKVWAHRKNKDQQAMQAAQEHRSFQFHTFAWVERKRKWLFWDENHHKDVRKGRKPLVGAALNRRHDAPVPEGTIDASSISYDRIMHAARAERAADVSTANTTNSRSTKSDPRGVVLVEGSSDIQTRTQQGILREGVSPYVPF